MTANRFLEFAAEARRLEGRTRFMAVTKTRTADEVNAAIDAGFALLGENRAQELTERKPLYRPCEIHFIGQLQTNKVRQIVRLVDMIESVDSARLAREIDRRAAEIGRTMPVLVEINIAREPQKGGVLPEDAGALLEEIGRLRRLEPRGLMTVGAANADPEARRQGFRAVRLLRDELAARFPEMPLRELSMGMSADYPIAIEEGATIVRLGSALFGPRA